MINENAVIRTKERTFFADAGTSSFEVRKGTNNTLTFDIWEMEGSAGSPEKYITLEFTKADTEKFLEWINATTF